MMKTLGSILIIFIFLLSLTNLSAQSSVSQKIFFKDYTKGNTDISEIYDNSVLVTFFQLVGSIDTLNSEILTAEVLKLK
ncbi:MAG: hypothetical protein WC599_12280, partial [Bacteroidales bacterium]